MFTKTFSGGVHPNISKEFTIEKKITKAPIPNKVIIPLLQSTGQPAKPLVKVGDTVLRGQLVGETSGFISSSVHASISGKVIEIKEFINPIYGKSEAVFIEGDGKDEPYPSLAKTKTVEELSREDIIEIVKSSGIVGLGGAAFPTHVKLISSEKNKVDSLIVNGAECEPYLTCDHRLMLERTKEIIEGSRLLAKAAKAENIYIAIEDNKLDAISAMEEAIREVSASARSGCASGAKGGSASGGKSQKSPPPPEADAPLAQKVDPPQAEKVKSKVIRLKTKYPQGAEKHLIKAILNREVPPGKLPLDVGCLVQNVGTVNAVYEALYEGRPLIERCITLTGSCLNEPGNFIVRIGTLLSEVVEGCCKGFVKEPKKIIVGGPMMGIAQYTLDIPIIKGVTGVVFLSSDEVREFHEGVCIRCGKCVDVCPVKLVPTALMHLVRQERFAEAKEFGLMHCFECGACAYICPAKIPLLDYMKFGKAKTLFIERRRV